MANKENDEKFIDVSLKSLFDEVTKDELVSISDLFDYSIPTKLRKADYINHLADKILNHPESWLKQLTLFELDVLQQLSKLPTDKGFTTLETFILFPFEESLCVISIPNADDTITYFICNEVKDAIAPCIDRVIAEKRQLKTTEIEQLMIGYINLRGFTEILALMMEVVKHYPEILEDNPYEIINNSAFLRNRLVQAPGVESVYLIDSPYLEDPSIIINDLVQNKDLSPKEFTKEELLGAANYPVPTIPNKYADQARTALMKELNIDAEKANWYMLKEWVEMQGRESQIPFPFLLENIAYKTKASFNKFFSSLVNYHNNAPRWIFNGLSSIDMNHQQEKTGMSSPLFRADDSMPHMDMSSPEEMAEMFGTHYNENQYSPKVGRNDPCLCGSGKKFKKCCGNN